jgi:DNA invertase Pin-like site-specific DNA recombinase
MTKITPEHLAGSACVYIRQSTPGQLAHNHESRRRQYGLVDRAKQLGWSNVDVIDDDLGRSGGGITRPGVERLLATICDGRVGAVLAIEASRLARNGRDWHTLLEFCGLVGTLIVDEDGIYDPRHPNDRLLLGMKGTMSELELATFRQRSQESLKQKARRGALLLGVAAGYVKIGRDRIEKNPDRRVQEALQLVFTRFAELQSARQVHIWLREEGIELPVKSRQGEAYGVVWRLPAYNTVHNILTNPIYAGAYAFGRTKSRVSVEGGRKRIRRGVQKPMAEWDVLIKDHHAAYITWDAFERNLEVIANNATGMTSALARGAARDGELLMPGLLRCGHCGRKLHVHYGGKIGRYDCQGALRNHGAARCISISGLSIDAAITKEVLRVLKPLGIEAALKAIEAQSSTTTAAERQLELSCSRHATKRRMPADSTTPSTRQTGWSPASWSAAGTTRCRPSQRSKESSRP